MRQRLITALIAAPLVLAVVAIASPWPILYLTAACLFFGLDELCRLEYGRPRWFAAGLTAAFFASGWMLKGTDIIFSHFAWLFGLFLLALWRLGFLIRKVQGRGALLPGFLWLANPLAGLTLLHWMSLPETGSWFASPMLLAVVPVWAGDSLAILFGKAFGKRPLWPELSPGKTWEGAFAHLIGSVAMGTFLGPLVGVPLWAGVASGAMAGVLGQYGDLFESAIKRTYGAKESGSLFPGHGGMLDRLDSVLMTALPVCLLLAYLRSIA